MKITDFEIEINRDHVLMLIDCNEESEIYFEVVDEYEEILEQAYEKIKPVALLAMGNLDEGDLFISQTKECSSNYSLDPRDNSNKECGFNVSCDSATNQEKFQGIFCITSIGGEISEWSTQLFKEGDYLKGMLVDAIADDYLFQMGTLLKKPIIEICQKDNWGVMKRLEAPRDIVMDIQKKAWEVTKAKELAGIGIKESFMLDPVKSTCQIFLLKENSKVFNLAQDCSSCPELNCKVRKTGSIAITVEGEETNVVSGEVGESILEILQKNGVLIPAPCGGKGICGKCKVWVIEGQISPSKEDIKFFSKEELEEGCRLACYAHPQTSCAIRLKAYQEEFDALTVTDMPEDLRKVKSMEIVEKIKDAEESKDTKDTKKLKATKNIDDEGNDENIEESRRCEGEKYGIAVDIGTTTIAMQLVKLNNGEVKGVYTATNSGRSYGADVISRIEASNKGHGGLLRKLLLEDLHEGIGHLLSTEKEGEEKIIIERMHIAANTTLVHLLMGYSCETLGVSPFTPVNIDTIEITFQELFGEGFNEIRKLSDKEDLGKGNSRGKEDFPIKIFPGISTFVGGDIVAGLYGLNFEERDGVSILVDLGTNGEVAIGNKDRIIAASTAAGPAFEGVNITCGVGSIPGGIYKVTLKEGQPIIKTIRDKPPIGICGTGVIDVVYELLDHELMDETGLLEEDLFEEGFYLAKTPSGEEITFTQKDIREIQLAKSAIRAGIETLVSHYGVTYNEVENIYIAGGFGYKLDVVKAIGIGLLPKEAQSKIKAVGNSALHGVKLSLYDPQGKERMEGIAKKGKEIDLGSDKTFNQLYMEHMYYGQI